MIQILGTSQGREVLGVRRGYSALLFYMFLADSSSERWLCPFSSAWHPFLSYLHLLCVTECFLESFGGFFWVCVTSPL